MVKFCVANLASILLFWGPFASLCIFTLIAKADDLNIYLTLLPPIMAKVKSPADHKSNIIRSAPFLDCSAWQWVASAQLNSEDQSRI